MDWFPIVLTVHLLLAIGLVGVVLLQRSEGGALGLGGGGGGGGVLTGRAAGDLLTRTTAILAGLFFVTSLTLAVIANVGNKSETPFDRLPAATPATGTPAEPALPAVPAAPAVPVAPLGR